MARLWQGVYGIYFSKTIFNEIKWQNHFQCGDKNKQAFKREQTSNKTSEYVAWRVAW